MSNKIFEKYSDKLMPIQGKAETQEGETIRAINKIGYRYYNDGDKFNEGYGIETAGSSHAYLIKKSPLSSKVKPILDKMENEGYKDKIYEEGIEKLMEVAVEWIESKKGNYTPNEVDMLEVEPLFEEEDEMYDDYWDEEDEIYDDYWDEEYDY